MSASPRAFVHQCPKCKRHVLTAVDAAAWCLPCGARMRIVERRPLGHPRVRKHPGGGRTDNGEGTA